ncbi:hypothetical protein [Staphylococcus nepalensis]|uniref:hypothetical protein n=1 Tax=Staphylococcus nepalensis TaxID=214473 RepID=UPI0031BAFDA8
MEFITTKGASEILNISTASLRSYAQHMEYIGYKFRKENNARQFTKHDIEIIQEAMELFKYQGGTMKGSLQYVITKEIKGEEAADNLEINNENQNETSPFELEIFKNDLLQNINSKINSDLDYHINKVIEVVQKQNQSIDSMDDLKSEIENLKNTNKSLEQKLSDLKTMYSELENENAELRFYLTKFKSMGLFEFRKWKKEQ